MLFHPLQLVDLKKTAMPKDECRESRPILFSPDGIVWAAAAEGVLGSGDVDENGRFGSPVNPTEARLLPYQRQNPPWAGMMAAPSNVSVNSAVWGSVTSVRSTVNAPSNTRTQSPSVPMLPRQPLATVSGNEEVVRMVLSEEIRALEIKAAALAKHVAVQNLIINGFCKLRSVE